MMENNTAAAEEVVESTATAEAAVAVKPKRHINQQKLQVFPAAFVKGIVRLQQPMNLFANIPQQQLFPAVQRFPQITGDFSFRPAFFRQGANQKSQIGIGGQFGFVQNCAGQGKHGNVVLTEPEKYDSSIPILGVTFLLTDPHQLTTGDMVNPEIGFSCIGLEKCHSPTPGKAVVSKI